MSLLDVIPVQRRTMNIFFMVDISDSMRGNKIIAVNNASRNVIPIIEDISNSIPGFADAEIKIVVMTFSDDVTWIYPEPRNPQDFIWKDLEAGGQRALGKACLELSVRLSRNKDRGGYIYSSLLGPPVIILLSNGVPTDDFEGGLRTLKQNNWFKSAIKVAIAIGDDADKNILAQFTGNREGVFIIHNIDALEQIFRAIALSSGEAVFYAIHAVIPIKKISPSDLYSSIRNGIS